MASAELYLDKLAYEVSIRDTAFRSMNQLPDEVELSSRTIDRACQSFRCSLDLMEGARAQQRLSLDEIVAWSRSPEYAPELGL